MIEIILTLKGSKKPSEGIMQMVDSHYMNVYIFKLEEEEVDMLIDELQWEELDYSIIIND